ncbi:hypothetical protein [Paenibacillus arenilitoris]|uniref:Uncharacterized protein n=1 Tax=Paenibacillus arenilitoris TaxID=2772299 RepID=A0A927CGQ4_9BACL|nr:hypothetical protein [Paenibacillus arenilitoris]MBD2867174.1 hypothetical protein [Paenibacillus arenilitoris]
MKKKWVTMGAVFGIGAVMLTASGLSAMASTSGYEAYKSAVKNVHSAASMTTGGTITVTDNGRTVLSADLTAKINHDRDAMSAAVTVGDGSEEHTMNMYRQDGQIILDDGKSGVYKRIETGGEHWKKDGGQHVGPPAHAERIIDALMGSLKDLATVEATADGGKLASLHLSGSQIPAVANAVGSLFVSNMSNGEHGAHWGGEAAQNPMHPNWTANWPKLTDQISVEQIELDADINPSNYLERQEAEIVITGKDESGASHEVVITVDVDLSGFNETVPDAIDLTGKQVETIRNEENGPPWAH